MCISLLPKFDVILDEEFKETSKCTLSKVVKVDLDPLSHNSVEDIYNSNQGDSKLDDQGGFNVCESDGGGPNTSQLGGDVANYGGLIEQSMVSYLFHEHFYRNDLEVKIFFTLIIYDQNDKLKL